MSIKEKWVIMMIESDDRKIVFRLCNMCKGKGKVCYGGMGDVFIYECPACNGTGNKR
jgi:hypothetical protein